MTMTKEPIAEGENWQLTEIRDGVYELERDGMSVVFDKVVFQTHRGVRTFLFSWENTVHARIPVEETHGEFERILHQLVPVGCSGQTVTVEF